MKRVTVDLDAGTDDAHALLLLLHADKIGKIKLEFIICSTGNAPLNCITQNVIRLLEAAKRTDIPVYRGIEEQLIPPDHELDYFHGSDGFGDLKHEHEPDLSIIKNEKGVIVLGEFITKYPKEITLICLGPLTNLGITLKLFPEFGENLKDIFIMGGNHKGVGNTTSAAEYNFYLDPESVHITLEKAKCPITILTWETCLKATIDLNWRFDVLGKINNPVLELITRAEKKIYSLEKNVWLPCDAYLTAVYLYPECIQKQTPHRVSIELHGTKTRGQLLLDHMKKNLKPNVTIIEVIDVEMFKDILLAVNSSF